MTALSPQPAIAACSETWRSAPHDRFSTSTRLARQDPTNAAWQRDVSVSHEQIADVLLEGGDTEGALAEYRASLAIAKALAERDPTNTAYRADLAATYDRLALIHEKRGEPRLAQAMKAEATKLR